MQLLNVELIKEQLITRNFTKFINFYLFPTIDSTNLFLKKLPTNKQTIQSNNHRVIYHPIKTSSICRQIDLCCAEEQKNGRGRFGRQWYSPFGTNIYCSWRWQIINPPHNLEGLSLVIGLAVLSMLKELQIADEILIKWPNDLLWRGKKICGILVEILEKNSNLDLIIGVGLNVNMLCTQELAAGNWGSLYEITGEYFDRNLLIAALLAQIDLNLENFIFNGFKQFRPQWQTVDYLYGQQILAAGATGSIAGTASGVDDYGKLCLVDTAGFAHVLSAAVASITFQPK